MYVVDFFYLSLHFSLELLQNLLRTLSESSKVKTLPDVGVDLKLLLSTVKDGRGVRIVRISARITD